MTISILTVQSKQPGNSSIVLRIERNGLSAAAPELHSRDVIV